MILRVESENGPACLRLDDVLDFGRLHAELSDGMTLDRAAIALAEAGAGLVTRSGDILLLISWIEDRAPRGARGTEWLRSLGSMIDYARTKGWYSAETNAVRVHIAGARAADGIDA